MHTINHIIRQNKPLRFAGLAVAFVIAAVFMLVSLNSGNHCILVADAHHALQQEQCFDTFAEAAHFATGGEIDSRLSDEAALASLRQIDRTAGQTRQVIENVGSESSVLAVMYDGTNREGKSGLILASSGCDAGGKNYDMAQSWQGRLNWNDKVESIELFSACTVAAFYSNRAQSGSIFYCDSRAQVAPHYCATLGALNNHSSSMSIR